MRKKGDVGSGNRGKLGLVRSARGKVRGKEVVGTAPAGHTPPSSPYVGGKKGQRIIGVLAVMGSREEHEVMLKKLGFGVRYVRKTQDLEGLSGLVLPGGESTTIDDLSKTYGLVEGIRELARAGKPVLGTCAGMILLSKWGLLDIVVDRNAYGRQVDSFEKDVVMPVLGKKAFPVVCIRAPKIAAAGEGVEVLGKDADRTALLVRKGNVWAASFHPELTEDARVHEAVFGL